MQLFDKLITTKLWSSPVFDASRWFPSGYRACLERELGSYFQTGPDVMTGPNLNTGKSVQICQKRWAVSCKQLRVGNERESNLKPTQGPNISFGFASGFFKQSLLRCLNLNRTLKILFLEGMSGTIQTQEIIEWGHPRTCTWGGALIHAIGPSIIISRKGNCISCKDIL